jgi:hypothetical protein
VGANPMGPGLLPRPRKPFTRSGRGPEEVSVRGG